MGEMGEPAGRDGTTADDGMDGEGRRARRRGVVVDARRAMEEAMEEAR